MSIKKDCWLHLKRLGNISPSANDGGPGSGPRKGPNAPAAWKDMQFGAKRQGEGYNPVATPGPESSPNLRQKIFREVHPTREQATKRASELWQDRYSELHIEHKPMTGISREIVSAFKSNKRN